MPGSLVDIAEELRDEVETLSFSPPVRFVYNPLRYAWDVHRTFLDRYGQGKKEVLFVGMNPGPFGMAQTGVPFGDVGFVRDWMGITGEVRSPEDTHAKRPVLGFSCERSEVSGSRLWGWAKDRCGSADAFFSRFFVHNYCPLVFLESSGRNRTPDKLTAAERSPLEEACDKALRAVVADLQPSWVIGIGVWAEKRVHGAVAEQGIRIGRILHPSPASPAANRGWAPQAESALNAYGIVL